MPDGVCFYPNALAKQSRKASQIVSPSYPGNPILYLLMILKAYEMIKPYLFVVMRPSC